MFKKLSESLNEKSPVSNIRINATIMTIIISLCIIYITIFVNKPETYWELYVGLFAVALGAKAYQKSYETKNKNKKEEEEKEIDVQDVERNSGLNKQEL